MNISMQSDHAERAESSTSGKALDRSDRDDLTGLLRYQPFLEEYRRRERLTQSNGTVVVIFIDADNMKTINDGLGHSVGDQLIIEIARIITANLGSDAFACRKGGDEFIMAVNCQGIEDGLTIATEIWRALSRPCIVSGHEILLSCSVGVSVEPIGSIDFSEQIQHADIAMYWAKSCGKNQLKIYDEEACSELVMMHELSLEFSKALDNGHFSVVFQPIYSMDVKNHQLVGAEALVRWRHERYGSVPAEMIVKLASKSGKISALGRYVASQACTAASKWPGSKFISVNFTAADFLSIGFADNVIKILGDVGLPPSRLRIEITESELLELNDVVQCNISSLKEKGIKIGVDDFGTGYSSMGNIDRFPADFVKIDRSLIDGCNRRPSCKVFIKAIKSVSEKIGFELIAEGVENLRELVVVRGVGISMAQGYYFCKPLASTDVHILMQRAKSGLSASMRARA